MLDVIWKCEGAWVGNAPWLVQMEKENSPSTG